ncbi:MAG TPA: hypothetical protein VKV15_05765 [Bryobacteraceae bacterium]|nr:hypothetical protein [Bryobacteraceae bacterium]
MSGVIATRQVDPLKFLSKVEHSFVVPGRGCVIVPAVPGPDVDFRFTGSRFYSAS